MRAKKRLSLMIAMAVLVGLAIVGSTIAYLSDRTGSLANAFTLSDLTVEIIENGKDPSSEHEFPPNGGRAVKEVKAQNTGNVSAYIRLTLVPTIRVENVARGGSVDYSMLTTNNIIKYRLEDAAGNTVEEYILEMEKDWQKYWIYEPQNNTFYCNHRVPAGDLTEMLLQRVTVSKGSWQNFKIEVLADAISVMAGEGVDTLESSGWGKYVELGGDGLLKLK